MRKRSKRVSNRCPNSVQAVSKWCPRDVLDIVCYVFVACAACVDCSACSASLALRTVIEWLTLPQKLTRTDGPGSLTAKLNLKLTLKAMKLELKLKLIKAQAGGC